MSQAIESAAPSKPSHPFGEDYFLRGPESGLSNYVNYSWKRDLTVFCAARMMLALGARSGDRVLDYGCARGYYVAALRLLGYQASGFDISEWAVANCHPEVKEYVTNSLASFYPNSMEWVVCKDVLEHIPEAQLAGVVESLLRIASKGILIIVPLCGGGNRFVAPQDNEDKTHVNCWYLETWVDFLQKQVDALNIPALVSGGFRLRGVKEACDPYPRSVGFLTIFAL